MKINKDDVRKITANVLESELREFAEMFKKEGKELDPIFYLSISMMLEKAFYKYETKLLEHFNQTEYNEVNKDKIN